MPLWTAHVEGYVDGSILHIGVSVCGLDQWSYFDEYLLTGDSKRITMPNSDPDDPWDLDPVLRISVTAPDHAENHLVRSWDGMSPHDVSDRDCDDIPRFKQIIPTSWVSGWTLKRPRFSAAAIRVAALG